MPIDLADYTKPVRDALRQGGYACVYATTIETPVMSRVGYSEDLVATIGRLQKSIPSPLLVENVLWVPDRGIATNISRAVQCDLMPSKRVGGWFDVTADTIARAIELAAFRIHPGSSMAWHEQLMAQWRRRVA